MDWQNNVNNDVCDISDVYDINDSLFPRQRQGTFIDLNGTKIDWLTLLPVDSAAALDTTERETRVELVDRVEQEALNALPEIVPDSARDRQHRVALALRPDSQITNISFTEYVKNNKINVTAKIVSLLGISLLFWGVPGAIAFGFNRIGGGGFFNTIKEIFLFSAKFYTGSNSTKIGWGVKIMRGLAVSAGLYYMLIHRPVYNSYARWRLEVHDAIQNNPLIPDEFADDDFLIAHSCPISSGPIRFPVYETSHDSSGREMRIYYEQSFIYAWLENNSISPMTRKHLTREDLIFDMDLYRNIEQRLMELDEELEDSEVIL